MSHKFIVATVPSVYKTILSYFPSQYFRYCFAYGSGVFKQGSTNESNPMLDLIFVVDDSLGFHGQNVLMNSSHYSFLKYFGHRFINKIHQNWTAKVYFNTLIPIKSEGVLIKYGVVNRQDLINDLFDWNYLYLAGRLHKPVLNIIQPTSDLQQAIRQNYLNALHTALLILPQRFTERQLFTTIVNLSYNGDFRMIFGEDKKKIQNIVNNQIEYFRQLYLPILSTMQDYVAIYEAKSNDIKFLQDKSSLTKIYHLFQLPRKAQQELAKTWVLKGNKKKKDIEEILKILSIDPDIGIMLTNCLKPIVYNASYKQSLKGILTAGITRSFIYSNKKIAKMIKSM